MALIEGFTREKCLLLGKRTILDVVPYVTTSLFKINVLRDKYIYRSLLRRFATVTTARCRAMCAAGGTPVLPDACHRPADEVRAVQPARSARAPVSLTSGGVFNFKFKCC